MAKTIKLTPEKITDYRNELDDLITVRRAEVQEKLRIARGFGDLSENAEFDEAKNEQAQVEARIIEITAILRNAEELTIENISTEVVGLGNKITLLNHSTGKEVIYTIVGTKESNVRENKISDESPIGKAVFGHTKGEKVTAETPKGDIEFTINEISK